MVRQLEDWHPVLANRALLYDGTPYVENGREYIGADMAGIIIGVADAIGRPLGDSESLWRIVHRLSPVRVPKPGDIVVRFGLAGIILNDHCVLTSDPGQGARIENWGVYSRRYKLLGPREPNPMYEYYCLLRGVWHVGYKPANAEVYPGQ